MSKFSKGIKKITSNPIKTVAGVATGQALLGLPGAVAGGVYGNKMFGGKPPPAGGPGRLSEEEISYLVGNPALDAERIKEGGKANAALRRQQVNELAGILSQANQRRLGLAVPGIAEHANVNGIYRSTGFGNALAEKSNELEASSQEELKKLALSGYDMEAGANEAALGRTLSLEDYGRELRSSSYLGDKYSPKVQSPGKVGSTLAGGMGGAAAGAPFGGAGAAAGGGLGAIAGLANAKGK